jgi:galactokinase
MINIKAPGRICLFGEHQDYLGYPTLSMAISKYINLKANRISELFLKIELLDVSQNIEIPLINKQLEYESSRDYLRSGYNIFLRKGARFKHGYKIRITGNIPINAGCGSSSALVIAWLHFLSLISDLKLKLHDLAQEGYNCEVKEFNEAGGQMDHFTSTLGNVIYLESGRSIPIVSEIKAKLDGFVLGDSLEKKNTVKDLIRVKQIASNAFMALDKIMPNFNYLKTPLKKIEQYLPNLKKDCWESYKS